ncbi:hypothetical protein HIM_09410 [Hirsutella minnesotensis 3608]|uniref:Zinc finger PHD-type domain-containing protein n=1 Tax=Hirsutella minnesotensis 3608 TaxID=1043627 RepID=A0A0F8A348_9HYPO|nr:hypothetical protein HIM_09410 [Hirsutella minnesotensis 3608]
MPSRKRHVQVVDDADNPFDRDISSTMLDRLRNMWQFANLCQWIYIFGKAAKIDESIDVEEIEAECLKPDSTLLTDLALSLLKLVSSHRGLTRESIDDQLRKQYSARAPGGIFFAVGDKPCKFADLDVPTKIKILQQLTQWAMVHPERLRDKMEEQKDVEQTSWRIEPYGWDREDRTYYVLDDNRVYRLTETTPPYKQPKPAKKMRRSSKRQRILPQTDNSDVDEKEPSEESSENDFGRGSWECVAITLPQVQELLANFGKTRDQNEKILRRQLETHLVPILEKQEEGQKRKQVQRERELLNLAKMANAKRSSRIAGKMEKQKEEDRIKEEEEQRKAAQASKQREEQERFKAERERDFRTQSRQRRLQEREARRLRHQEELAQLSEDNKTASSVGRISERRLQIEIERNKQALKDLEDEDEEWVFDCVCGLHGQVDDGAHSVACEKCNVWQHSKCLDISEREADCSDFHFICDPCKQQKQAENSASKNTIKLKLHPTNGSSLRDEAIEPDEKTQSMKPPTRVTGPSKETIEKVDTEITVALSANEAPRSTPLQEQKVTATAVVPPRSTPNISDDRSAPVSSSQGHYAGAVLGASSGSIQDQKVLGALTAHSDEEVAANAAQGS